MHFITVGKESFPGPSTVTACADISAVTRVCSASTVEAGLSAGAGMNTSSHTVSCVFQYNLN